MSFTSFWIWLCVFTFLIVLIYLYVCLASVSGARCGYDHARDWCTFELASVRLAKVVRLAVAVPPSGTRSPKFTHEKYAEESDESDECESDFSLLGSGPRFNPPFDLRELCAQGAA